MGKERMESQGMGVGGLGVSVQEMVGDMGCCIMIQRKKPKLIHPIDVCLLHTYHMPRAARS